MIPPLPRHRYCEYRCPLSAVIRAGELPPRAPTARSRERDLLVGSDALQPRPCRRVVPQQPARELPYPHIPRELQRQRRGGLLTSMQPLCRAEELQVLRRQRRLRRGHAGRRGERRDGPSPIPLTPANDTTLGGPPERTMLATSEGRVMFSVPLYVDFFLLAVAFALAARFFRESRDPARICRRARAGPLSRPRHVSHAMPITAAASAQVHKLPVRGHHAA